MTKFWRLAAVSTAALFVSGYALAGPAVVNGPPANPECFKPWNDKTKFFQWTKKVAPTASPSSTDLSATPGAFR